MWIDTVDIYNVQEFTNYKQEFVNYKQHTTSGDRTLQLCYVHTVC